MASVGMLCSLEISGGVPLGCLGGVLGYLALSVGVCLHVVFPGNI